MPLILNVTKLEILGAGGSLATVNPPCVRACGGMQKPRQRVRSTEPLPTMYSLYRYSTLVDLSNFGLRRMHGRGPPQSACPTHAGNLVPKPRKKQVFSGSDGGLVMQRNMHIYGHMRCMYECVPFTGFSTSSTLTLWILSKHSKPQPV